MASGCVDGSRAGAAPRTRGPESGAMVDVGHVRGTRRWVDLRTPSESFRLYLYRHDLRALPGLGLGCCLFSVEQFDIRRLHSVLLGCNVGNQARDGHQNHNPNLKAPNGAKNQDHFN